MNLVLTIAIGNDYQKMAQFTHSSIKGYAKKIGAEFKCIDKQEISSTSPHWEKFQIYKLLEKYDRILYIDTDVLIREDCPNLFDIVPEDNLGMFNEAPFTNRSKELMIDICRQYDVKLEEWDGCYYNSGVMVISKIHKNLFKKPEKEVFSFYEQSYINMVIALNNVEMFNLPYQYNRMTCLDIYTGEARHASYIIHYAGYPSLEFVLNIILLDKEKWSEDTGNYNYKKNLLISVGGGLGDQLCAEPALRYLCNVLYPEDNVVILTHWPRLFNHLVRYGVNVFKYNEFNNSGDISYYTNNSLPKPESIQGILLSNILCHTVDYCSIALMRRTLPHTDKNIIFKVEEIDYNNLYKVTNTKDLDNFVVIHPGKHWNSKTFPDQYWQDIIDLCAKKYKVAIVGKTQLGDPPDYIAGARGTVDVNCPDGALDLRDKLNLGMFGALLSKAKILISNDSAPVHLAGAFDNWIILLPSCKHPDHILPYRNGTTMYKTKSLYKRLVLDDIDCRPTNLKKTTADIEVVNWEKYLVDPIFVINSLEDIK